MNESQQARHSYTCPESPLKPRLAEPLRSGTSMEILVYSTFVFLKKNKIKLQAQKEIYVQDYYNSV